MSRPRSATALRRRTERPMRGASGSARPASQPALLGLQTRLQGSNPRRQQRLVKTLAISIHSAASILLVQALKLSCTAGLPEGS